MDSITAWILTAVFVAIALFVLYKWSMPKIEKKIDDQKKPEEQKKTDAFKKMKEALNIEDIISDDPFGFHKDGMKTDIKNDEPLKFNKDEKEKKNDGDVN